MATMPGPVSALPARPVTASASDSETDARARHRSATCRSLIEERRLIGNGLGFDLCPAPVWDILLDLYLARQEGHSTYMWQACVASNIALSSAHRKISELIALGLVERTDADTDKRRVGIRLTLPCVDRLNMLMDRLSGRR